MVTNMGRGVFLGGQPRHCICTNASRGLSAIAEFLVLTSCSPWRSSILLPVFNGKGDPMECGCYRAIKLLEHAMKVIERVLERRIREKVKD